MKNIFLTLGTVLLFTSCSNLHKATLEELKSTTSNYQMSYDAMRRGAIVSIRPDGKINKILSEVQPDAAIARTTDITSTLMGKLKSGDSVSAEQMTKITESLSRLGERTAPVNMLRDALYRLEEHCINFEEQCKGELYWTSFNNIVNNITELQGKISETAKEEANKAKAQAEEEKAKTLRTLTPEERKKYDLTP
ncbi:hypothetical protein ACNFU2_16325 [Chryseobacterium sp. PTM-20240506]|uniref:hypothetical protein n=1 Tax=unclassified Chryseobacterium TaxID=2593645 RepID=UPI0015536D52|nr:MULTISPECIES: hypothetical protein [unclassified Chryseobacterium]MDC8106459.1 hypothetical protein [Chryseobacterium sp. B21-037]MDQ1804962.1 hypothetical protein [Chryseobacterium sp. CKR4-1]